MTTSSFTTRADNAFQKLITPPDKQYTKGDPDDWSFRNIMKLPTYSQLPEEERPDAVLDPYLQRESVSS